jgi:galacturan 1,4-alpha-galacturonidase
MERNDLRKLIHISRTVTVVGSRRLLLEDIYVSATSNNSNPPRNTDGANTMFSDSITFRRWHIDNGDDCIATKANSTNILIEDSIFHNGQGVAIGSIGQYNGHFETVENVTARNITMHNVRYLGRIKTWTGEQNGYPPNGGGGGIGCKTLPETEICKLPSFDQAPTLMHISCAKYFIPGYHDH